jgi:putative glycosyltransferase (TIGR04372 family)
MKAKLKFFICFIIYIVINIIKFFFKKKIKLFFVYQERIGAVTYQPYSILSKKKNIFFILIFLNKAANNYAYKFWKKYFFCIRENNLIKFQFLNYERILKNFIYKSNSFTIKNSKLMKLNFLKNEKKKGKKIMNNIGIKEKFIIIHNRDSKYLSNYYDGKNMSYHNFRDFDVNDFCYAAKNFINHEYQVVRFGKVQKKKFNCINKNNNIIDYAFSNMRSDFMDFYLNYECAAYFGSDSGVVNLPLLFGKPLFHVNYPFTNIDVFSSHLCYDSFIPKKILCRKTGKLLGLREILSRRLFGINNLEHFNNQNIKFINNSPKEIYDYSNELIFFLNNNKYDVDYDLQKKFWDIFYKYSKFNRKKEIPAYIGKNFLKKNLYLLNL